MNCWTIGSPRTIRRVETGKPELEALRAQLTELRGQFDRASSRAASTISDGCRWLVSRLRNRSSTSPRPKRQQRFSW